MVLDRAEIAAHLRERIHRGDYATGTKLPSYRDLARTLGAAPNTVGEAVRTLATEGLVKIKTNSRAIVQSPDAASPTGDPIAAARDELTHVRGTLRSMRTQLEGLEDRVSDILNSLKE
jgi:DNA-binding FadR family transcriptional regulator